jgi:hypothetical protein
MRAGHNGGMRVALFALMRSLILASIVLLMKIEQIMIRRNGKR